MKYSYSIIRDFIFSTFFNHPNSLIHNANAAVKGKARRPDCGRGVGKEVGSTICDLVAPSTPKRVHNYSLLA